jgi:hypothetical protein
MKDEEGRGKRETKFITVRSLILGGERGLSLAGLEMELIERLWQFHQCQNPFLEV